MSKLNRKILVNTSRFLSDPNYECSYCPMQEVGLPDDDQYDEEYMRLTIQEVVQMFEDDDALMKAWRKYGKD